LRKALKRIGEWTVEIIKRSDTPQGFEVLPRRWVVERTFAWLGQFQEPAVNEKRGALRVERLARESANRARCCFCQYDRSSCLAQQCSARATLTDTPVFITVPMCLLHWSRKARTQKTEPYPWAGDYSGTALLRRC
jgi:hypothetical protein